MSGSALAVTTGIAAGVLLLGTAAAGFHDLAGLRPARPAGPAPREGPMIMPQATAPRPASGPSSTPPPASGSPTPPSPPTTTGSSSASLAQRPRRRDHRAHPPPPGRAFTILAGQAHFTLDGEQRVAGAGETIVVPAGVPHSEGNPGPGEIEGIVELRPALRTKEWHEALAGLVADGKTTPRGAPKNPLQLGATFWHFRHESRVTSPPIWVQNLMLPPLWALAKALRHPPLLRPLGQPDPRCRMSLWRTTTQPNGRSCEAMSQERHQTSPRAARCRGCRPAPHDIAAAPRALS